MGVRHKVGDLQAGASATQPMLKVANKAHRVLSSSGDSEERRIRQDSPCHKSQSTRGINWHALRSGVLSRPSQHNFSLHVGPGLLQVVLGDEYYAEPGLLPVYLVKLDRK